MKKILLLLFSFLHCSQFFCLAQCNLVPNPSFEIVTDCSNGVNGIFLNHSPPWDSPTDGSPDLFNSCSIYSGTNIPSNFEGFQHPHSGSGYGEISTIFPAYNGQREYVQVELDSSLIINNTYCISFFVNLSDSAEFGTNNIGIYFSTTHTYQGGFQYLNFVPQINYSSIISDTANWVEISGTYTAQGGERYIIIGNFYPDALTDIFTIPTNYTRTSHFSYYYIDDVDVHRCTCNVGVDELKNDMSFHLSPNPSAALFTISSAAKINQIKISNMLGEEIKTINNATTIDLTEYTNGIYFAEIKTEKGITNKKLIKQ
ncbi:MAG: T9SS type A sorting domain-containing protein [Bacteroidota bacterium]